MGYGKTVKGVFNELMYCELYCKYNSPSFWFTVIEPVPGTKTTLATDVFLRPIPKKADFVSEADKDI